MVMSNSFAFLSRKLQEFCFQSSPSYAQAQQTPTDKLETVLDKLYQKYEVEEDEETKSRQWNDIIMLEKKMAEKKRRRQYAREKAIRRGGQHYHKGNGPYDVGIKGVDFFRLPHKVKSDFTVEILTVIQICSGITW